MIIMLAFGKKYSILESGILDGWTDWHCHILPGVDDGVRTLEDAKLCLAFYEQTGVRELWLTPHIMEDCPNGTGALQERFAQLQAAYSGNLTLHLAAENMMDNLFDQRLKEGDILTIGGAGGKGEMILVETSYFNPPMAFEETLNDLILQGRRPLLAHPERYEYMDFADYARLKEAGVLFQLNLMSLTGIYGKNAARKASRLLLEGKYDFTGSDLHSLATWQRAIQDKVLSRKEVAALKGLI